MKKHHSATVLLALVLTASIFTPLSSTQAADPCVPESVIPGINVDVLHPGQFMGLLINDEHRTTPCATLDPGWLFLSYQLLSDYTIQKLVYMPNWYWADISYEWITQSIKNLGISSTIRNGSNFSFNFYRGSPDVNPDTTVDSPQNFDVRLSTKAANPCKPETATLQDSKAGANSPTNPYWPINDNILLKAKCRIEDPGWIYSGWSLDGSTKVHGFLEYYSDWRWGGSITWKNNLHHLQDAGLKNAVPARANFFLTFFRSNNSLQKPNLKKPTFAFEYPIASGAFK
jgi:hypothetical protein